MEFGCSIDDTQQQMALNFELVVNNQLFSVVLAACKWFKISVVIWWAVHKICESTYILSHRSTNLIFGDSKFQIIFSVVDKKRDFTHGLCARRTLWYFNRRNCYGVMKRHLCNLDLRDLPEVYEKHCLFINKFDLSVDAKIVACLHEFLTMNKDRWEIYRNYLKFVYFLTFLFRLSKYIV